MQICFLFVTLCQCIVSAAILALILWPQPLRLNSALTPRPSDVTPSASTKATPSTVNDSTDAADTTKTAATTSAMIIHDQKLGVGWRSLTCAAPSAEHGLRKTKFDERLAGFGANKNHSLGKFPDTKLALTCLTIEPHRNECICFAPLWLSMLALAAAISFMVFFIHLFAFCMIEFRMPECVLFTYNWGLLVSVLAAAFWVAIGRLFNVNVVEKWPFKFATEIGTVEDYFVFPLNWHVAHLLCYSFIVLLAGQLCTWVCDVMLSESATTKPVVTAKSSSNRGDTSSSTSTNRSGRRSMVVIFQSNLTQLCHPRSRSDKNAKRQAVGKEQQPSAATSMSAATLAMPSTRSTTPLNAKSVAPVTQPQPPTMPQQQDAVAVAPKVQGNQNPVNLQKPGDQWRTLHSQKSLTVPSIHSIAVVDRGAATTTAPGQKTIATVKKNVVLSPLLSFGRMQDVQQPSWLNHPPSGQQTNPAPVQPPVANHQAVPGSKKHSREGARAAMMQRKKMPSKHSNRKIAV